MEPDQKVLKHQYRDMDDYFFHAQHLGTQGWHTIRIRQRPRSRLRFLRELSLVRRLFPLPPQVTVQYTYIGTPHERPSDPDAERLAAAGSWVMPTRQTEPVER